jgi:hypothetical protein
MELDRYLSQAVERDRETRMRNEQDFIEMVKSIRSELALLTEKDQGEDLEPADE